MVTFKKATRHEAKLRMALVGPSGSGKSYSALAIATGLGGKIAVIDSERGGASKFYGEVFDFDALDLESFGPEKYQEAVKAAEAAGYSVIVIDSLSHAWQGVQDLVDHASRGKANSFEAWRTAGTPAQNKLVECILDSKCHVIVTMRVKTEYVVEANERGKMAPRKVGLAPVQRAGLEYEFDVVGDMDECALVITKSRISEFAGKVIQKPGKELGTKLAAWLGSAPPKTVPVAAAPAPAMRVVEPVREPGDDTVQPTGDTEADLATALDACRAPSDVNRLMVACNGQYPKGHAFRDKAMSMCSARVAALKGAA